MRVLVIDDSAFIRSEMKVLLESISGVKTVRTAIDGVDGFSQAVRHSPDVIMLDLDMPNMDGFTFLRLLYNIRKTPVIVVTGAGWEGNARKAISLGAFDFIEKPVPSPPNKLSAIKVEIERKLKLLPFKRPGKKASKPQRCRRAASAKAAHGAPEAVVIGASTGGPRAVSTVVKMLPEDLSMAVCISIHIPRWVAGPLAERLNNESAVSVSVATDGELVTPGRVLLAPGGYHLSFLRTKTSGKKTGVYSVLTKRCAKDLYAPSVDRLFESAASVWGSSLVGVIMTGMGSDGKKGVEEIKGRGGYVLAESRESSGVFGMPGAAISTGMVDKILSMHEIGAWLAERHAGVELKLA
jgi:two-component system chemotaxis response regulator CheB